MIIAQFCNLLFIKKFFTFKINLFNFYCLMSFSNCTFKYFPCIFKVILVLFNLASVIVFSKFI